MAFPSLGWMQHDIVTITTGLLGGDRRPGGSAGVRGYLTSGGTESLLQATKTARDWGRAERGIDRPNMVLATSAHAAFAKASHYFDVESRRVPVRPDGSADVDAMADAVDDRTVLVVGSAPSYPQGVIDPIPDLAALAAERGDPLPRRRLPGRLPPARSSAPSATSPSRGTCRCRASPRSAPTSTSTATPPRGSR